MSTELVACRVRNGPGAERRELRQPVRTPPRRAGVRRLPHVAILALCWLCATGPAAARSLEEALIRTFPDQLHDTAATLASEFSRSVAASYPVPGTSAAYAYRFDPTIDSYRRLDIPLGPVFSERARTVGEGNVNVIASYLFAPYDEINGDDLDDLVSDDPTQSANHIRICVGESRCEPVLGRASIDLEAQILSLSVTYGVLADLDISISLPIVRTSLRVSTSFTGPDPRAPADAQHFPYSFEQTASESSTGVGDLLLRAKYLFGRWAPVDLAAGLTLSLPTGDAADFHGTGATLVGVALYASRVYLERVEPHVNTSFVIDASTLDRSQFRYSVGADVRVLDWLTLNNDFLGRTDLATADTVDDAIEFSTGFKMAPPWRRALQGVPLLRDIPVRGSGLPWTWFFNVLLPLNDAGVRSDHIFSVGAEAIF